MQSMTGYGRAEVNFENNKFIIEIKSLNSKYIDSTIKMDSIYRKKEIELRKLLSEKLQRGKIELFIWEEKTDDISTYTLNKHAVKDYYNQIINLQEEMGIKYNSWSFTPFRSTTSDIIPTLLKLPNVVEKGDKNSGENAWEFIEKGINIALEDLLQFRIEEGKKLSKDIKLRINKLSKILMQISPFEKERSDKIKESLFERVNNLNNKNIDKNRFEQEIIYYLEKQDITEEKTRLSAHLEYFSETIKKDVSNGKKLGFISQEIGREINTIGSKASHAEIQKLVVQMKDELEKIKEQLLNIL